MEIKKYFKNRKKFVDISDSEEYNDLLSKLNFVKGQEAASFFSKDEVKDENN